MKFYDYLSMKLATENIADPNMIVIDATAVAKTIDDSQDIGFGSVPGGASFPAESYGVVAPPFDDFFIESKTHYKQIPVSRGVFFTSLRNPETLTHREPTGTEIYHNAIVMDEKRFANIRDYHFAYLMSTFALVGAKFEIGQSIMFLHLDENGLILTDMDNVMGIPQDSERLIQMAKRTKALITPHEISTSFIPFALMAISSMHKKAPVRHVTPTKKEQRRHMKKNKTERPLFDYYELEIDPKKSRIDSTRQTFIPATVAPNKRDDPRVHSVRGHFKYYTEERPLFGRVTGLIWYQGHFRGNSTQGEIVKSYKVK